MKNIGKILVVGVLSMFCLSCKSTYIAYSIFHGDDYNYNANSKVCLTDLEKKGHAISFNFDLVGNSKLHELNVSLKSKENFQSFSLDKITINYCGNEYELPVYKKLNIVPDFGITNFEGKEIGCYRYFFNIPLSGLAFLSAIENFDIKDSYENLQISFFYLFDDNKKYEINCLYKIKETKRKKSAPDFIYKLFPEMGI